MTVYDDEDNDYDDDYDDDDDDNDDEIYVSIRYIVT